MLFSSYEFIFLFLPVTLAGLYILASLRQNDYCLLWLVICSLFFYAWWNPPYVLLIAASIAINYGLGQNIIAINNSSRGRHILVLGICLNLGLLGYYKYTNFFISTANLFSNNEFSLLDIMLPIGISFFTFQQIAYLVDCHRNKVSDRKFINYALFVCFYPQLIAGPIVHHQDVLPQFLKPGIFRFNQEKFVVGLSIFQIGLFKKVVLADSISQYTTIGFSAAARGEILSFTESWAFAILYTLQIYFDFSAYSDMAIGLGWMTGIQLPLNFNSPYRSTSIRNFWQNWNITLMRFFLVYIYEPLRRSNNIPMKGIFAGFCVYFLSGLWHGAAWTFVLWGIMNWFYMIAGDWLGKLNRALFGKSIIKTKLYEWCCRLLTFIAITSTMTIFGSANTTAIKSFAAGMINFQNFSLSQYFSKKILSVNLQLVNLYGASSLSAAEILCLMIGVGMFIVWFLPSTAQFFNQQLPASITRTTQRDHTSKHFFTWKPTASWGLLMAIMTVISLLSVSVSSEFIYFRF